MCTQENSLLNTPKLLILPHCPTSPLKHSSITWLCRSLRLNLAFDTDGQEVAGNGEGCKSWSYKRSSSFAGGNVFHGNVEVAETSVALDKGDVVQITIGVPVA